MNAPITRLAAGFLVSAALAACSVQGTPDASATASGSASTSPSASTGPAASVAESATVSANSASREELVAALTAAGVPNADRWATEVMEYRPYATDDPTLQKLQDNLAKYDPDAATLAAILAALTP
jgi:DNA uptake protein ComE-like DNA-binding protein